MSACQNLWSTRVATRHTPFCSGRAAAARRRPPSLPAKAAASHEAEGRDPSGLSSLRLFKPAATDMDNLMQQWGSRECNHEFAGASASAPDVPQQVKNSGFMITKNRRKVGEGQETYDAAIAAIKSWQHLQLGWNCTTAPPMQEGATICSATQTVVPWSVLPARVVYCQEEAAEFGPTNTGRRFSVGMCSLHGHQLAGEERFLVELHADGSVWYDIYLFSRPDTYLAWASLPVVKVMQIRYVLDGLKAVEQAVKA